MFESTSRTFLAAAILCAGVGAASAHEFKAGSLTIEHPWSRATPAGATVGAGYTIIDNAGDVPDRLVSATAEVATKVSAHSMTTENGVMQMREVTDGIAIPAHGSAALKPGALHLMFEGLKRPLKLGESVPGTLVFEKAGTVKVTFKVEAIGAVDPHAGMKMN